MRTIQEIESLALRGPEIRQSYEYQSVRNAMKYTKQELREMIGAASDASLSENHDNDELVIIGYGYPCRVLADEAHIEETKLLSESVDRLIPNAHNLSDRNYRRMQKKISKKLHKRKVA